MQEYDLSLKCLVEKFPEDFENLIFGETYQVIKILPTELRAKKRIADYLAKVKKGDSEFILHIEFESSYKDNIRIRMLNYYSRLVKKYKLPVYQVVIYLNPKDANKDIPNTYYDDFLNQKHINQYHVIKVGDIDPNLILNNKWYGLYPLLPLTKNANIKESLEIINKAEVSEKLKKNLYFCAVILGGLKYKQDFLKTIIQEDFMKESSMYQYLFKEVEENAFKKGRVADILLVIKKRFKRVPKRISTKIRAIKDTSTLEELLIAAVEAKTIKDFEKKLNI